MSLINNTAENETGSMTPSVELVSSASAKSPMAAWPVALLPLATEGHAPGRCCHPQPRRLRYAIGASTAPQREEGHPDISGTSAPTAEREQADRNARINQSLLTSAATERTPFFITGLPRSRTAWLAAWVSAQKLCLHDVPPNLTEWATLADGVCGYSGAELALEYGRLRGSFPDAKWLVVIRDLDEAVKSFRTWASVAVPDRFDVMGFFRERAALLDQIEGRRVRFEDLSDVNTAKGVWDYLMPPRPGHDGTASTFDSKRFFFFDGLNIQQRRPTWL